jgi:type II secretory pathway pseudopilin PulG
MTILEMMIVLAVIGGGALLVRSGFRLVTKADLVENSTELAAMLRRASQLSIEYGEMHRVTLDLDKQLFVVEVCQGQTAIVRNDNRVRDKEDVKRALEAGQQQLRDMPADALAAADPEAAMRKASAIAGHHISDRTCVPVEYARAASGDAEGKAWVRALRAAKGIKFKEVWVQHRDESITKGQVSIYFWPVGSAEKAVVMLTDGSDTFTVLVHGLTGRVELRDEELRDVDDHMMRNALGDEEDEREETNL